MWMLVLKIKAQGHRVKMDGESSDVASQKGVSTSISLPSPSTECLRGGFASRLTRCEGHEMAGADREGLASGSYSGGLPTPLAIRRVSRPGGERLLASDKGSSRPVRLRPGRSRRRGLRARALWHTGGQARPGA